MTRPRPPRSRYEDVCAALRNTIDTALADDALTLHEARLVLAVIRDSAAWSRIADLHFLGHIAARAYGVDRAEPWQISKTSDRLRSLASRGIVAATPPPPGRPPKGSQHEPNYLAGVVTPPSETAPRSGGNTEARTTPGSGGSIERKPPPEQAGNSPRRGAETAPTGGPPTETSESADRRSSGRSQRTVTRGGRPAVAHGDAAAAWTALVRAHLAHRGADHLASLGLDGAALIVTAATDDELASDTDTTALAVAAATARHTREDPAAHIVEAERTARHLHDHYAADIIATALRHAIGWEVDNPDDIVDDPPISRPASIANLARHIRARRNPFDDTPDPLRAGPAGDARKRAAHIAYPALHDRYAGGRP